MVHRRIPNRWLGELFWFGIGLLIIECIMKPNEWKSLLMSCGSGMLIGGSIFFACYVCSKGSIGAGDVKLMAMVGFYIGKKVILETSFFSVLSAAGFCIWNQLRKKSSTHKKLPFAPFVLLGVIMMVLIENKF